MIIRAIHDRDNPFFLMRRATAQDKRLSWQTRGVLAYLFSRHDDWTLRDEDLIAQVAESTKPLGRDSLALILKELRVNGYLRRIRKQGKNGRIEWDTEIYETPYTAQPSTAQSLIIENRRTKERETKEREQQQQSDFTAAAGKYQNEPHCSRFSFEEIETYVMETKEVRINPGGLARMLFRSGEEDEQISAWFNRQQKQQSLSQPVQPEPEPEEIIRLAAEYEQFYPNPAERPEWVNQLIASAEAIKAA